MNTELHTFDTRGELAEALAATIADRLSQAVTQKGEALLAVSGGTTPGNFFRALSTKPIDWARMTVTLVDERFVPPSSERSNEYLVRSTLLRNRAERANFVPLFEQGANPEAAALHAEDAIFAAADPRRRLDAVVLGMGTDGHTASFFPDAAELPELLDLGTIPFISPVHAASAGETRLTMTMPAIASAPFVALHIEGVEKKRVLDAALEPASTLPIAEVFRRARNPVQIFWAP